MQTRSVSAGEESLLLVGLPGTLATPALAELLLTAPLAAFGATELYDTVQTMMLKKLRQDTTSPAQLYERCSKSLE